MSVSASQDSGASTASRTSTTANQTALATTAAHVSMESTHSPASAQEDTLETGDMRKPVAQRQEMVIGTLALLWYFTMVAVL